MDSGFHDFTDPKKGLEEIFERFKEWHETGYEGDMERVFSALSVTLMHLGIDNHVYDITMPYSAVLHALDEHDLADAMAKVTMRIGRDVLAVAYSVHAERIPWNGIDEVPEATRDKMTFSIVCVLRGMGATVTHSGDAITITGWDCNNPDHDHGGQPVTMNIDQAVSDFRQEIDRELGDSANPMSRWMPPKKEED